MDTTPPPTPARIAPHAPLRPTRKAKRARAEAEDLEWLMGRGVAPNDGGIAKLTCTPPKSVNPGELMLCPFIQPEARAPAVEPLLLKYTPLSVRRIVSDDPMMEKMAPATEPQGEPC